MTDHAALRTVFLPLALQHDISWSVEQGRAQPGEFLLGGEVNLGPTFEAALLDVRVKAIRYREGEAPQATFDPDSDLYVEIAKEAGRLERGSYAGPEFLVYLPARSALATLFCARTSRNAGRALLGLLEKNQPAVVTSRLVLGRSHDYHVIDAGPGTRPVQVPPSDTLAVARVEFAWEPRSHAEE